jgi:selenoprotein W-related protein
LREVLGVEAELLRGSGGIFEVRVDGNVVARKTLDGFPTPEQIVEAVRKTRDSAG